MFTTMKVFAFLLASLFVTQASIPAMCMTSCVLESVASSSCCLIEKTDDCCMMEDITCSFVEAKSCCAAVEMTACTISEEDGIAEAQQNSRSCSDCNIPCCSAPLCCFYFQEITDLNFSLNLFLLTGQLPSKNGTPESGYRGDCFQPPEFI